MLNQARALIMTKILGFEVSESSFRNYAKQKVIPGVGNKEGAISRKGLTAEYPDSAPYQAVVAKIMLAKKYMYSYDEIYIARMLALSVLRDENFCLGLDAQELKYYLQSNNIDLALVDDCERIAKSENTRAINLNDAYDLARTWLYNYVAVKLAARVAGVKDLHLLGERELAEQKVLNWHYPCAVQIVGTEGVNDIYPYKLEDKGMAMGFVKIRPEANSLEFSNLEDIVETKIY